ncbi:SMI1/KNR4 family protein [Lentzea californiensis]|uniref:SMI1/KNR4 family protein n=1 Tax=Lentzea californiensis TaxID=438851 RepID=UPI0021656698|nr:SMI1/KNR4 family protein [Lentzea californiensis]MCR3749913.1 Cell wall assembly regulator SMI1 [Lentzea californiensis]
MTAPVSVSWGRIEEWCRHNDIENTLRPPAHNAAIEAAEAEIGHRLPADLLESLRRHDGTTFQPVTYLVPRRWILLPLEAMLETWRWKNEQLAQRQATEIDDFSDEDDEDWSDVEPGEEDAFWGWNPNWLPIALDGSGCHLVVELRPGALHGAIGQLDPESDPRFEGVDTHSSTAALLDHTADALRGNGAATARVQNNGIRWS